MFGNLTDPAAIGAIVFASLFGGALAGIVISAALPDHHLSKETQDVVRLGMGMLATLAALVIGLLVAAAHGSFDTKDDEIKQFAVNLILLDRQLVHYGPEAKEARDLLRRYTLFTLDATWTEEAAEPAGDASGWMLLEDVQDRIRAFAPVGDAQHWLQARALQISGDLARTRWLLDVQAGSSIPRPFLVMLVLWLTAIFSSFGLFAPRNATAVAALLVCSLSLAGALFLILEMDRPFEGLLHISSAPLREALANIDR